MSLKTNKQIIKKLEGLIDLYSRKVKELNPLNEEHPMMYDIKGKLAAYRNILKFAKGYQ